MTKVAKNFALALLLLGFVTLCPSRVNAWGASGHRIVAMIAEDYLTDNARGKVSALIGDQSLADIANYADAIRNLHPETRQWHFVDIELNFDDYVPSRDCPQTPEGDCVINAPNWKNSRRARP